MTANESEYPDTRASLLLQLQAGDDQEAWQEFVTLYRPIIYRLARKRGLQDADAQDLSQQVLVSIAGAIERWEKQNETVRFRFWLRRVAKNAICNAFSRQPVDRAAGGSGIQNEMNDKAVSEQDVANDLALEHRREVFWHAAKIVKTDVAADTWQVFECSVIEGMPIEQVAARLNKSVGAAYAARGRVMSRLRNAVESLERSES